MMGIKWVRATCAVGLLCGLLAGCDDGNKKKQQPQTVQQQTITFTTAGPITGGAGTTVTNVASGGAGTGAITYASSNTAVAPVDAATGVASLLIVGSATITATKAASTGFASATATYTLNVSQGSQTLTFATAGPINALLDATATNLASGGGGTGAITYASSDTKVVSVNAATGATTAVGVGSATVTATKAADANFLAAQASYTINVQTAGKISAWIGENDAIVSPPQSANGKVLGSATVAECQISAGTAECLSANLANVSGAPVVDTKATLTSPAYYAILNGGTLGAPVIANASKFSERIGHAVVHFNGRYWVIGGATPMYPVVPPAQLQYQQHADVWSSEDGASWKLERADAEFGRRWLHRAVVYKDAIWLISGHAPLDRAMAAQGINDVYRSTDGVNWVLMPASVPLVGATDPVNLVAAVFGSELWVIRNGRVYSTTDGTAWPQRASGLFGNTNRAAASLTAFAGKLWYIAGVPGFVSGGPGSNPNTVNASRDVFTSPDGLNWTQEAAPPFTARFRHLAFARNNRLWVFGGQGFVSGAAAAVPGDAWSTDGTTWTQETTTGRLARGHLMEAAQGPTQVMIAGGVQGTFSNQVWLSTGAAQWEHRSSRAQFAPRHTEGIAFNGYLWAIGGGTTNEGTFGSGDTNDVWRSADGLNWTRIATTGAIFSPRDGHRLTVHNNRLWLIGGWENETGGSGLRNNEVWSTADGASWTQHAAPPFSPRVGHGLVTFGGRMWVIGGSPGTGVYANDVWSSADGENWRQDTANAAFSPRSSPEVVAFNNAMWLIGGGSPAAIGDVWRSTDGVTWTARPAPAFPARTWHSAAVLNGRIYVIAGSSDEAYDTMVRYNDVWSTADGATWTEELHTAPFNPRGLQSLVVHNSEFWMFGGMGTGYLNEVWRSPDGKAWRIGFSHDIQAP